ncbi:Serine-threonine protein kinase 19 [Teratosphaeria destructans]|uniref:Serine-threonine protein kinase 19 n=1 Tax=Teratosphaeria destructans TaxID=418781 RepID=A0A9W7W6C9_9PEZI|nr:Serine-threonine protein kinase 19 [Teratosphaeria destructans]
MPKASPNPLARRKPSSSSPFKKPPTPREDGVQRLQDTGLTPSLASSETPQDVISLIRHIQARTWQEVPERAAGMGSERISEVLRFRALLPPIVSIAHLHALSTSSTKTERELAKCISQGIVRRLTIPGRGKGGSAVGEGVVLVSDWKERLMMERALREELKINYTILLDRNPASATVETKTLTNDDVRDLVTAGFLTSPSALSSPGALLQTACYNAATGTDAAVGGSGAVHEAGGSGSMLATRDTRPPPHNHLAHRMTLSLPGTGAYLKLLTEARLHLLHLLRQISPRYKESTMELLKEKWEGNTLNDATSQAKRARGEWAGVLPGKTKKWRQFYGMEFEAVLAECVGSGLIELFDTGMGAVGVRAR